MRAFQVFSAERLAMVQGLDGVGRFAASVFAFTRRPIARRILVKDGVDVTVPACSVLHP